MQVTIRAEEPHDCDAIRKVNEEAFGDSEAASIVQGLRDRNGQTASLVATLEDRVIGHIFFSPVTIARAPDGFQVVGLGPMSVLPKYQNKGVGSRLVREGLALCKRKGYQLAVVLGHPSFYPRFGFSRASAHGLGNEYGADEAFMVVALERGALDEVSGLVKYAPEFVEAG
jgi:putative acetyltransferase